MKRLIALIISALLLVSVFALTSCDQEAVDNARSDLLDTSKDLLDPFFNRQESSTDSERVDTEDDSQNEDSFEE